MNSTTIIQQQQQITPNTVQKLASVNEQTWLTIGSLAEMMAEYDKAVNCYESALRHNPYSIPALTQIASLCRGKEQFGGAIDYFKRILAIQESNGEIWASLGHCYLMMDNLQDAYQAYQQALYHLANPKDPKLWYGIGILYDRYGSLEHAEEAFSAIMKMDSHFEKANEIYFRLGIIYKQQRKFDLSLQCFHYILHNPPRPLTESDIWFQTGHVYEQKKEYEAAKEAYEHVLTENPDHAKVLQQLGWLYHQPDTLFCNQQLATQFLNKSLKADSNDAQSWYLLGRCYMAEQNHTKAYESYQQAVYRDARNPIFWCSIGVLYYQINQYRDALDAYSRAIRLNPYISEVWYDLGTLYESCNNQVQDALDAYQRAADLDPTNPHIKQRLEILRKPGVSANNSAPVPQDVVNPSQYSNNNNNSGNSFDQHQRGEQQQRQRLSDSRGDITAEPGRNLPMLTNNTHNQRQQQQVHHIPDINGRRSSLSPPPVSSTHNNNNNRMNPMIFNSRDTLNPVTAKEELKSPQPSSFVPDNKNTAPTTTTTTAAAAAVNNDDNDEEMTEATNNNNTTTANDTSNEQVATATTGRSVSTVAVATIPDDTGKNGYNEENTTQDNEDEEMEDGEAT